jgi:hypothetical protein
MARTSKGIIRTATRAGPLGVLCFLAACGSGGGSGGGVSSSVGDEVAKPGGGTFFVDPNQGGGATRLGIAEMFWARLVDVHDIEANGVIRLDPVFRDFAINENIQSDGTNYLLETNPITEETRLVILRQKGAPSTGGGTFTELLELATRGLPPIAPKNDDGTAAEPFSFVTRNAGIIVRFDDCLDDDAEAESKLVETVKVLTGYPPVTPFGARVVFDPNHGALTGGVFHSTRVLIDTTVSQTESAEMSVAQPINSLGLPASLTESSQPNVSVRIPTQVDFSSGQFEILTNLAGSPLSSSGNGPNDASSPTFDVVRAMRSGNPTDLNNGFLLDLNAPEIVGNWGMAIEQVSDDPTGTAGLDFVVELRFNSVCQEAPRTGSILSTGERFVEVSAPASAPDDQGLVSDVRVRVLGSEPISNPGELLGSALYLSTYTPLSSVPNACWYRFTPQPTQPPSAGVATGSQVLVRFSEPMDPASITAFDTFMLVRGDTNTPVIPTNIVVGTARGSADLKEFSSTPLRPFGHTQGVIDVYHVALAGPTDLAGNGLANELPPVNFSIDPTEPSEASSGLVLQFDEPDVLIPLGALDLRGQFFFDLERGVIKPRPVSFSGVTADRTNPVPSIMIPFPPGVQTPLAPLGSKLHTVWRYADFGWQVLDETKHNVDVIGLNWSPIGGQVLSDFYEEFEIRLSHSRRLPDEAINAGFLVPLHPDSGLVGSPNLFTDNILADPASPQRIVHPRSLGYFVNPGDRFVASTGTPLMPYPLNRNTNTLEAYTWRDTAALSVAGPGSAGIPMDIEVGLPLLLENGPPGVIAEAGLVPTYGLPLLMEYRCFPSDSGIGLNAFDISLAVNSSSRPNFRSFSTGGLNTIGNAISKNPNLELVPSGGYNPGSTPPGKLTKLTADNSFYIGQLDIVIRVSRVHTIWLDSLFSGPNYFTPIIEPGTDQQPAGTQVQIDYRGALSFDAAAGDDPFDGSALDPYGDLALGAVVFLNGETGWTNDIRNVSGARYVQVRFSFINNIETGLNAELSAIGIAYEQL